MFIFQKQVAKFMPLNGAFPKQSERLFKSFMIKKNTIKLISNIHLSKKHIKTNLMKH